GRWFARAARVRPGLMEHTGRLERARLAGSALLRVVADDDPTRPRREPDKLVVILLAEAHRDRRDARHAGLHRADRVGDALADEQLAAFTRRVLAEEVVVADLGRDVAVLLTVRQQLLVLGLLPRVDGRVLGPPRDEVDDAIRSPVWQHQPPAKELAHFAAGEHEQARSQRILAARAAGLGQVLEEVAAAP